MPSDANKSKLIGKMSLRAQKSPEIEVTWRGFLHAIFGTLADVIALVHSRPGDPKQSGGWYGRDAADVDEYCSPRANNYFNISTYPLGTTSAKKDAVVAVHALVLDDIGTKSQIPLVGPTYAIETSQGNSQYAYVFDAPLEDLDEFDQLQDLIVGAGYGDAGAKGAARWVRMPGSINGKTDHVDEDGNPFKVRLTIWNPEKRFSPADLIEQFGIKPALVAPAAKAAPQPVVSDVYMPQAAENPVVTALKAAGLYKHALGNGAHAITCPWCSEHTDQVDDGACFFEPSAAYPLGGSKCHHGHCTHRKLKDTLEYLGLSRRDVRNRPCIRVTPGELPGMVEGAELVLAQTGEFYQLNGKIVRIIRSADGKFAIRPQGDSELTLALASVAEWEYFKERDGKWARGNPHKETVRLLEQLDLYRHLPVLKAMAWQPVLDDDGKLLFAPGYDANSGLFLAFDPGAYDLPEPTMENAGLALAALFGLLSEFHFATERDRATALAAIFTAVLRPGLGRCPAFHVNAPSPGSGKSYLCEVVVEFASPTQPAKISYPTRDEEASKVILAVLLHAPAVVEFDDMASDWKSFGAMNRMLTSASMTERVLGASATATVSTDVLVLGSGNNVGPRDDLLRRVCVIDLDARNESPSTLAYRGNPVATVTANREAYITHVLTIVRAFQGAGCPSQGLTTIASYSGRWTTFCREPLVWLGLDDPARGLIEQQKTDENRPILSNLLKAWHAKFRDRPVMVREFRDELAGPLVDAIDDLPFMQGAPFNPGKFGWYLKRNANRLVDGLRLERADHAERTAWRVVPLSQRDIV